MLRKRLMSGWARSSSFSPSRLPNLVAWYKADAIVSTDGSKIATWADSSGSGNPALQPTSANQPTFNTNVVNGLPVVNFKLANLTYMQGYVNSSQALTIFAVMKKTGNQDTGRAWAFINTAGPFDNTGTGTWRWYSNAGLSPVETNVVSTNFTISTYSLDSSSNCVIYNNGAVGASSFAAAPTYFAASTLTLGSSGFLTNLSDVSLAEIILYTRQLTTAEQRNVEKYLGSKYAITVT